MIVDRIDAITKIPEEYRKTFIKAPKSVKIELTGKCNFACTFCARSNLLRKQEEMSQLFYERVVLEMKKVGVQELGLFYLGESFMCSWLPEAIQYAKDIGFEYTFLTTNGSLSTANKVKACMEAGLNSLKFSYNYCDEHQLKEIANVKKSYFHKIQENIKEAKRVRDEGRYSCGLYASYIEYDGEQGKKMLEAINEIRPYVDEIYALPLYNQANLVTDKERDKGWKPIAGNRGRVEALRDPLPCWACFTEGHITWDGKLSACCFDHDGRFEMGDLTHQGFMQAWNSNKFQELRRAHLAKDVTGTVCEKCVAYG
jgi:radical SAM protein with 4Fe4S-binding SPASM domain